MAQPTVFGTTVNSATAAAAVGGGDRVRAIAAAPSRAAFARALIAAGLAHGSESRVARHVDEYGGQTGNRVEVDVATAEPGWVFIAHPDRKPTAGAFIPWPPRADTGEPTTDTPDAS